MTGEDIKIEAFIFNMLESNVYVRNDKIFPANRHAGFTDNEIEFLKAATGTDFKIDTDDQFFFAVNDRLKGFVYTWKDKTRDAYNTLWQYNKKLCSKILKG